MPRFKIPLVAHCRDGHCWGPGHDRKRPRIGNQQIGR